MRPNHPLSRIANQLMWDRLISVVEEQAQTLVRTAFGTPTREGDLSAGVYDTGAACSRRPSPARRAFNVTSFHSGGGYRDWKKRSAEYGRGRAT